MTERSVKRLMLGATMVAAAVLTSLAVAGLVVTSRGPQAQELPLARTSIAQAVLPGPSDAGDPIDSGADHPPVTRPSGQQGADETPPVSASAQTTTTTASVSAPGGVTVASSGITTRRTSESSSTSQAGTTTRSFPPLSLPPTSIVTLSSDRHTSTDEATDEADDVRARESDSHSEETTRWGSGEGDYDRELVSPKIRESDDDHDD